MKKLLIYVYLFSIHLTSFNNFAGCGQNSSTTDASAYTEGYNLGTANPGGELYLLSSEQNICSKYAKECTKFTACKNGFSDGASGAASNPPASTSS